MALSIALNSASGVLAVENTEAGAEALEGPVVVEDLNDLGSDAEEAAPEVSDGNEGSEDYAVPFAEDAAEPQLEEKGSVSFDGIEGAYSEVDQTLENVGIVSYDGIEGAYTEVDLPIYAKMPEWTGEVPEGKVFAGWTLNQGTEVYKAGEELELTTENGSPAFGKYAFVFEPSFIQKSNAGVVSFDGIDGAVLDITLPISTKMPEYTGEVPEGKVFAGWTLNQGTEVFKVGEEMALTTENGEYMPKLDKYGFVFEPYFEEVQTLENVGIVSYDGIEGAYTEVDLPIYAKLPEWTGEVPEGKAFAGWTLNRGTEVYKAGEELELTTENGSPAFGKYGFVFEPYFEDEEPTTEEPTTEEPTTEEPTTEEPTTEEPTTEAPATEEPTTEEPATEAPATEEPVTEEQETEEETKAPASDNKNDNTAKKDNTADKSGQQGTAVQTGDNTMVAPYIIILLVAAAVCVVLLVLKKKRTM